MLSFPLRYDQLFADESAERSEIVDIAERARDAQVVRSRRDLKAFELKKESSYVDARERERERESIIGERGEERKRDGSRETEKQRNRETEKQRDRETERQRDKETEKQRDREE